MELEGKVSLVTGASRGIGKAIALKLAGLGCKVAVNYVAIEAGNKADSDSVVQVIKHQGGEAMAIEADIRNSEEVRSMVEQIIGVWGKIDILVNNAGITRDNLLLRMSEEAWDDVIATNLRGAYLCTKFTLRSMIRQKSGRIISIASIAGVMGNVGQTNYAASKAGVIAFTKSVAREVGSRNITANAVAPGFIKTKMTEGLPDEIKKNILSMVSLRRFGEPEDVAELVAFLASDKAGYITGQVICIDGGVSM
ncbi:MAG: 3-oxoacyl-[acyl-carrier-protein] reductase [Chloroflexi bacterium CG_4_9_14_3_um_filter_45_9]|nr:MAG: 3-oxoacyl-[acyl-carrier-protein] reductase [Dehalococcoidia bacterium CG2_30_46_9]PIU23586.1 MAG: 3-oxoacyl-[acyl-carrier-protein] reductase [Chloroflexi bacterium CG08_land_8_20_14_0_20_45_12]PJB50497.1 MAG: 3-oxoacyl-[acyl-carrier-protein] reductase [Chloroflexi bacterium CG_4_9_14_3_um_filter_45_9]